MTHARTSVSGSLSTQRCLSLGTGTFCHVSCEVHLAYRGISIGTGTSFGALADQLVFEDP
jgi:hypothetical protein